MNNAVRVDLRKVSEFLKTTNKNPTLNKIAAGGLVVVMALAASRNASIPTVRSASSETSERVTYAGTDYFNLNEIALIEPDSFNCTGKICKFNMNGKEVSLDLKDVRTLDFELGRNSKGQPVLGTIFIDSQQIDSDLAVAIETGFLAARQVIDSKANLDLPVNLDQLAKDVIIGDFGGR